MRSSERSIRLSSSRALAAPSSKAQKALLSRAGDGGPSPRSRAREIAEETLWVSARISRSDSISANAYCRWPPGERSGWGKP